VYDDGTNAGVGTTSLGAKWDVKSQINVTSPSNISMNAVRASNFGYSTGYSALIIGSVSGNNTPCINVDPIANPSGSFSGLGDEVMFRNGAYFISPNSANTAYNQYLRLIDGYVQFTNSARAPIFYDSNDTSYYVDPNSASRLNSLYVANGTVDPSNVGAGVGIGLISESTGFSANGIAFGSGAGQHGAIVYGSNIMYFGTENGSDNTMTTKATLNSSGTFTANGDVRTQIFYDSNDTAYYVDPNSLSVLTTVYATKTGANNTPAIQIRGGNFGYPRLQVYGLDADPNGWMGLGTDMGGGPYEHSVYFPNGTGGTASNGRLTIGDYNGTTYNPRLYVFTSYTQINNSTRSPLFYDSDNTGYYGDFAGTSNLFNLTVSGTGNKYLVIHSTDSGEAMVQYIGASGSSWYVGKRTSTSLVDQASFHFYSASAGATVAGIDVSGNMLASGSMRAPIFYDNNNTAYYVDPATATNLAGTITQTGPGRTSIVGPSNYDTRLGSSDLWFWFKSIAGNGTSGYPGAIQFGRDDNVFSWPIVLNPRGGNVGVNSYSADYTLHVAGIGYASTDFRAPIFYDSNNTGYYLDPAGTTLLNTFTCAGSITTSSSVTVGNGATASYIYMADSDEGTRIIHCNSNRVGFLAQNGNWGSWCEDDGSWRTDHAMYSPVYYDLNNTGYYVDPASTSVVNIVNVVGGIGATTGGAGNDPYGKIAVTGATDANYAYYGLTRAGQFGMGMGIDTSNIFWVGATSGGYAATRTSVYFQTNTSGDVTASSSLRAPIFYDSNNTAYYVDPNSNSVLFSFDNINQRCSYSRQWDNYPGISVYNTTDQGPQGDFRIFGSPGANGGDFSVRLLVDGNIQTLADLLAGGAVYAPIYYDSNDTFFYLNPAGYSQMNGFGSVNGSAGVGMSIMGNVSNGAIMSFHRSAAYAVNMGLDTDNVLRIGGWSAAANRLQMDMSGNLTMAGNVTAYSDARLKKDVTTIEGALDLVGQMRGVRYTRIDTEMPGTGVIAQEMLEVMPEVVQQGVGDDDTLSVAYGNLVGVLIEAIKELTARVAELEGK
jgi:hypothetical protein